MVTTKVADVQFTAYRDFLLVMATPEGTLFDALRVKLLAHSRDASPWMPVWVFRKEPGFDSDYKGNVRDGRALIGMMRGAGLKVERANLEILQARRNYDRQEFRTMPLPETASILLAARVKRGGK